MFIPNRTAYTRKRSTTTDAFGQYSFGDKQAVRIAVVRFDTKTDDSTVRADSSATRGNIKEYHTSGRVLVDKRHVPEWGDLLIIDKKVFRIMEVEPRYNVAGQLDHYECDTEKAQDLFGDES